VQAFSSIAGGGVNYFDLKFLESVTSNVQLFHTVGHTDPICAYTGTPAGCGISENTPTMILTPVPEPSTYALYLGGIALGWFARRRRSAAAVSAI
ncbi:MAG: PEP-CTERM sorting domain-containing protein, partial [Caldimonas sp.]